MERAENIIRKNAQGESEHREGRRWERKSTEEKRCEDKAVHRHNNTAATKTGIVSKT